MPNGTKKRSNSNSYPSTDLTKARYSPNTDSNTNAWNGSQADQAQWLNAKLREAEIDYIFNALVATGAIPIWGEALIIAPGHARRRVEPLLACCGGAGHLSAPQT